MKSCLIVDDSEVIREIIVRLVNDLDLEPREASSAGEAVELCKNEKPDVVLLDWDLPSMGALDFLRGAGELPTEQRPTIVLCATENDPQQFTLAKAAGAEHHLLKPFDKDAMAVLFQEIGLIENAVNETASEEAVSLNKNAAS